MSGFSLGDLAGVGVLPYSPRRGGVPPINIGTPGARVIVYFRGFISPVRSNLGQKLAGYSMLLA